MTYQAEIRRATPSCFLFVIDQSGSMGDPFAGPGSGRSKAQELADVINRLLQTLVTRCAKGEEVRDYFEIGVLGYGHTVGDALQGRLQAGTSCRSARLPSIQPDSRVAPRRCPTARSRWWQQKGFPPYIPDPRDVRE